MGGNYTVGGSEVVDHIPLEDGVEVVRNVTFPGSTVQKATDGGNSPTFQTTLTTLNSLPTGISLSRATTGPYFDGSGVLQTAAIDAPRFDHAWNGSAWVATGLLIEEQRTNLIHPSTGLGAGWSGNNVTSLDAQAVAPDGTTTATKINPTGTGNPVLFNPATTSGFTTCSVFAKAVEYTKASMRIDYPTGPKVAIFDLSIGTVVSAESGMTASIQNCGAGWYRLIGTIDAGGSPVSVYNQFGPIDNGYSVLAGNITLGAADNTKGVYFWGAVEEAGTFATSYIPTVGAAATRSADIATLTGTALATLQGSAVTMIAETQMIGTPSSDATLIGDATANNELTVNSGSLTQGNFGVAASYSGYTLGSGNVLSPFRVAASMDGSGRSVVGNGGTVVTGAAGVWGAISLNLGCRGGSSQFLNGWVRSIAIYSSRLSDATLQTTSVVGAPF